RVRGLCQRQLDALVTSARRTGPTERTVDRSGTSHDGPPLRHRVPFRALRWPTFHNGETAPREDAPWPDAEAEQAVPAKLRPAEPTEARSPAAAGNQGREPHVHVDGAAGPRDDLPANEDSDKTGERHEDPDADDFEDPHGHGLSA